MGLLWRLTMMLGGYVANSDYEKRLKESLDAGNVDALIDLAALIIEHIADMESKREMYEPREFRDILRLYHDVLVSIANVKGISKDAAESEAQSAAPLALVQQLRKTSDTGSA